MLDFIIFCLKIFKLLKKIIKKIFIKIIIILKDNLLFLIK